MCGIVYSKDTDRLDQMLSLIKHRGENHVLYKNMGHTRLPLSGGPKWDQPLIINDHTTIGFVGEIFNYKSLNPEFESDAELIMSAAASDYKHFDGFYHVLVEDEKSDMLYILTDPLGKKPLYVNGHGEFSSEIKPLVHPEYTINETYLSEILHRGYSNLLDTAFNEIKKVVHNAVIRFDTKNVDMLECQSLDPNLKVPKIDNYPSIAGDIGLAIQDRYDSSERPVALLLSGGLDSTIIYEELKNDPLGIFHVENNEDEYLPKDADINYINLPDKINDAELINILYYNESPTDLGSMVPQYFLGRAIKEEGYSVCMTGDGADEAFLGYTRGQHYDSRYHDIFSELPGYHLPRLDKQMMAHTVEVRSPFLSVPVVRRALGIKYQMAKSKAPLKQMFQGKVDDRIIKRKKHPLKSKYMLEDTVEWRKRLDRLFREEVIPLYKQNIYLEAL